MNDAMTVGAEDGKISKRCGHRFVRCGKRTQVVDFAEAFTNGTIGCGEVEAAYLARQPTCRAKNRSLLCFNNGAFALAPEMGNQPKAALTYRG